MVPVEAEMKQSYLTWYTERMRADMTHSAPLLPSFNIEVLVGGRLNGRVHTEWQVNLPELHHPYGLV